MSILPTWPIAVAALAVGVALGAGADRLWTAPQVAKAEKRYADLDKEVREQARLREVKRGEDERAAREKEQKMATAISHAEEEKQNEIAAVRSSADALIDRLRKQAAASKPAGPGGVPAPGCSCSYAAGPAVPVRSGEAIVRLAERADSIRAGLAACYKWADAVEASHTEQPPR